MEIVSEQELIRPVCHAGVRSVGDIDGHVGHEIAVRIKLDQPAQGRRDHPHGPRNRVKSHVRADGVVGRTARDDHVAEVDSVGIGEVQQNIPSAPCEDLAQKRAAVGDEFDRGTGEAAFDPAGDRAAVGDGVGARPAGPYCIVARIDLDLSGIGNGVGNRAARDAGPAATIDQPRYAGSWPD